MKLFTLKLCIVIMRLPYSCLNASHFCDEGVTYAVQLLIVNGYGVVNELASINRYEGLSNNLPTYIPCTAGLYICIMCGHTVL